MPVCNESITLRNYPLLYLSHTLQQWRLGAAVFQSLVGTCPPRPTVGYVTDTRKHNDTHIMTHTYKHTHTNIMTHTYTHTHTNKWHTHFSQSIVISQTHITASQMLFVYAWVKNNRIVDRGTCGLCSKFYLLCYAALFRNFTIIMLKLCSIIICFYGWL